MPMTPDGGPSRPVRRTSPVGQAMDNVAKGINMSQPVQQQEAPRQYIPPTPPEEQHQTYNNPPPQPQEEQHQYSPPPVITAPQPPAPPPPPPAPPAPPSPEEIQRQANIAANGAGVEAQREATRQYNYAHPAAAVAAAPAAAPAPAPDPQVTIPDPLNDPTYKQQHADFQKALADFAANQKTAGDQYERNYNNGIARMGWNAAQKTWDPKNTQNAYGNSFNNNMEDFAARGAYDSGLYGKSVGDINNAFNTQKTDLDNGEKDYQDTARAAKGQYTDTNASQDRAAVAAAIGRIAQQYGIDPTVVTPGATAKVDKSKTNQA